MKIIAKPQTETSVLSTVTKNATAPEIYQGIVSQAQCCVVHLCGCSKGC